MRSGPPVAARVVARLDDYHSAESARVNVARVLPSPGLGCWDDGVEIASRGGLGSSTQIVEGCCITDRRKRSLQH